MSIKIVVPSYNSCSTIDRTLQSIRSQHGQYLAYIHVQDGGSTDGTVEKLRGWSEVFSSLSRDADRGIFFSFESNPDSGMYDAIARGFDKMKPETSDWLSWINSDDILMPYTFSYLSRISSSEDLGFIRWVTGHPCIAYFDGCPVSAADRLFSKNLISKGLCDGIHYDFVQQEGTFFKGSLWNSIEKSKDFKNLKLAGDWNLWRKFSEKAELFQCEIPLGMFFRQKNQKSEKLRDEYNAEINSIVGPRERAIALRDLKESDCINFKINFKFTDGKGYISKKNIYKSIIGRNKKINNNGHTKTGKPIVGEVLHHNGICGFDGEWQYPAITEQHAYNRMRELDLKFSQDILYFAFPWATLVDLIRNNPERGELLRMKIPEAMANVRHARRIITVCQHVLMYEIQDELANAGVTDVYWSHATLDTACLPKYPAIAIHSFPLYPVQQTRQDYSPAADKSYLFSFVGARSDKWYLSECRNWILDNLNTAKNGYIKGRDQWHYHKVVYDHQVNQSVKANDAGSLINTDHSLEFSDVLSNSIFSLCPSGSGPNSIRLWESIAAGAIPVIISDTHRLPGVFALWQEAVVFVKEDEDSVKNIPQKLEGISQNIEELEKKRLAVRKLWFLYGPQNFVNDISKMILGESYSPMLNPLELSVKHSSVITSILNNTFKVDFGFKRFMFDLVNKIITTPITVRSEMAVSGDLSRAVGMVVDLNIKETQILRRVIYRVKG